MLVDGAVEELVARGRGVDARDFESLVLSCGRSNALDAGKRLHALMGQLHLRFHDRHTPTRSANLVVDMYGRCGSAGDARAAFDAIGHKNVFSWGFLVAAYARNGHLLQAFNVLGEMCLEGFKPDKVVLISLVRSCELLEQVHLLRSIADECGLSRDLQIATELVKRYGKLEEGRFARDIFDRIEKKDVVAWNAMIDVYARSGHFREAFETYEQMPRYADKFTYTALLSCCSDRRDAEMIHGCLVRERIESDAAVFTALIRCYARCGNPDKAVAVFRSFPGKKDAGLWTAVIVCLAQNGMVTEAILSFLEMEQQGFRSSGFALVALLQSASNRKWDSTKARMIDAISDRAMEVLSTSSLRYDLVVATALVKFFGSQGRASGAEEVFERFARHNIFDLVLWNAMISVYADNSLVSDALLVLSKMDLQGGEADKFTIASALAACSTSCEHSLAATDSLRDRAACLGLESDRVVVAALVNSYAKSQKLSLARTAFEKLAPEERDAVVWTSMIMGYARAGHIQDALEVFSRMAHDPDAITIAQVLDAYAELACLSQCKAAHRELVSSSKQEVESDTMVTNALLHMYAKCGSLEEARKVFERTSFNSNNIVSWTAMISAYAQHGRGSESMELFQRMQQDGVEPNQVTFISILSSCSHSGLIDQAAYYLNSMEEDHGLAASQNHLVHVVDLLGRAGMLKQAKEVGESSCCHDGNAGSVSSAMAESLLGGCYTQGDREIASKIVGRAPESPSLYIKYSNIRQSSH